jgi:hypothetical protein
MSDRVRLRIARFRDGSYWWVAHRGGNITAYALPVSEYREFTSALAELRADPEKWNVARYGHPINVGTWA